MPQIEIGPEFFAKAKHDYSCWKWALIREFMQNSIDCGSRRIKVNYSLSEGDTILSVENDGEAMTEEVLVGKLLSLGSSGKDFAGNNVGGFGKAKEILYFCHSHYEIHSGNLLVIGRGAEYELDRDADFLRGTRSEIRLEGDWVGELDTQLGHFCMLLDWKGEILVNGTREDRRLKVTNHRKDLTFGKIYTRGGKYVEDFGLNNLLVCRVHGIPMFHHYTAFEKGVVVVEMDKPSPEILNSNRDSLKYDARDEYNKFTNSLAIDNKSALRPENPIKRKWGGYQLGEDGEPAKVHAPVLEEVLVAAKSVAPTQYEKAEVESQLGFEFIIKDETGLTIPSYYEPTDEMGTYAEKLAQVWAKVMIQMHRLFENKTCFSVGFVFSEECEAQHEKDGGEHTYYINPAEIVRQERSNSRSMKKRFNLTERNRLIMIALHEFIHGLGFRYHNEAYSAKLTDMAWVVMDNRKDFNWCF